jgi:hypothetical protein
VDAFEATVHHDSRTMSTRGDLSDHVVAYTGSRTPSFTTVVEWFALVVAGAIFVAYAGLIPLGQWQADEFNYFASLQQGLLPAFLARLQWSPRPVAELLLGAYGTAANHAHRPLTALLLAPLWTALLLSALAVPLHEYRRRVSIYLATIALLAGFLTGGPIFEVFYWPAAAVAYLPTLSATLWLVLLTLGGGSSSPSMRRAILACLIIAALTSEVGAIFVACYCAMQAGVAILLRLSRRQTLVTWHLQLGWILPGILAVGVLLASASNRLIVVEESTVASASLNHPAASALFAARRLLEEILGFAAGVPRASSALAGFLASLLLAMGFALLWSRASSGNRYVRREALIIVAALVVAAWVSLAASYYHFGHAGGQRYETLRRCWMLLVFAAIAVIACGSERCRPICLRMQAWRLGPIFLLAGVLLPWHASPLLREYSGYHTTTACVAQTFKSGFASGPAMIFLVPRFGGVLTPATLAPGSYSPSAPHTEYDFAAYILRYFSKQLMVVRSGPEVLKSIATGKPVP